MYSHGVRSLNLVPQTELTALVTNPYLRYPSVGFITIFTPCGSVQPIQYPTFYKQCTNANGENSRHHLLQSISSYHLECHSNALPDNSLLALKGFGIENYEVCEAIRDEILTKISGPTSLMKEEEGKEKKNIFDTDRLRRIKSFSGILIQSPDLKKRKSESKLQKQKYPTILRTLSTSQKLMDFKEVSDVIWKFYETHQQVKGVYIEKMRLRDALYTVIKRVFPCKLTLYKG